MQANVNRNYMQNLLQIFFEYFKIGLFNIGGGLATLPFLYHVAAVHNWYNAAEIPDMLAVSQLVPGAIGVNLMCYSGMRAGFIAGALTATLSFILPAIVIIIVIQKMYDTFKKNILVQSAFCGMRPCATGLLAAAGWGLLNTSLINSSFGSITEVLKYKECILFFLFFVLMLKTDKPPAMFIAAGAVTGIVIKL
ncbi:MAG: chromate transporter [Termitinemataceae bacterium]|nr:MAG: chromate transporter [Termitinemataceae bacterium]